MKNADPPDSTSHKPRSRRSASAGPAGSTRRTRKLSLKLTPELQHFIRRMGGYFESSGVPPIGGRILGLLMVAHEPLSAEDIASILHVSRASISTNFRVLAASGLAERYTSHADRTTYYVFSDTAWEHAMVMGIRRTQDFKRIVQEGLSAMPENDAARWHLLRGSEYADLMMDFYQHQIDEWRTHPQKHLGVPRSSIERT